MSNPEISTSLKLLLAGFRLDGRSLHDYREITFRFPQFSTNANRSSCIARIGATSVMATVSVEVVEPKSFRPSQGTLFVNFDTGFVNIHTSSSRHHSLDDEGRRLSTVLQTLLRDSIDLDSLCIVAWERVFAVRIELRTLSYDGNLGDCGALAALLSLATFRRPDIFVTEDGNVLVDIEAKYRPRVPLKILRFPVLVTFGLAPDMDLMVQDACAREEEFLTGGRIMVGVAGPNEICCLYTYGLTKPIESGRLRKCVHMAGSSASSLTALVRRVLNSIDQHLAAQRLTRALHADNLNVVACESKPTSLIISSTDFLRDDLQGLTKHPQHVSDTTAVPMDDSIVEDEAPSPKSQPDHQDPYGVIEISSLCTREPEAHPSQAHIMMDLEVAGLSSGYAS